MQLSSVVSQWRQDDRLADRIMEITAIAEESDGGGGDGKGGVDGGRKCGGKCGEKLCSGGCGGSCGSGVSEGSGEPIGLRQSCSLPELCPIPAVDWRVIKSHWSHGSDHSRGSSGELELPFSVPPRSNSSSDPQLTSQLSSERSSQRTSPEEHSSGTSVVDVSSHASRAIRSQSQDSNYFLVSRQEAEQNRQIQQHIKAEQRRPLERINDSDTRASPFDEETRREREGPPTASRPPCAHAFYADAGRDTSLPAVSRPPCASVKTVDRAPCASLFDGLCAFPSDSSCSSDVFADGFGGGGSGAVSDPVSDRVSSAASNGLSGAVNDGGPRKGSSNAAVFHQPDFPAAGFSDGVTSGVTGGVSDVVSGAVIDGRLNNGLSSAEVFRQPVFPTAAAAKGGDYQGGAAESGDDLKNEEVGENRGSGEIEEGENDESVFRQAILPARGNISSGPGSAVATGCGDSGRNGRAGSRDRGRLASGSAREVPQGVPRGVSLGSSEDRARKESAGSRIDVDSPAQSDPGFPVQMDGNGEIADGKNANGVGLPATPPSSRLSLRLRPPFAIAVARRRTLSERSDLPALNQRPDLGPPNHASAESLCCEPLQEAACLRCATDSLYGGLNGGLCGGARHAPRDAQAAVHSPHSVADFPMFSSPRVDAATLVDARGEATRVETTRFDPERSSRPLRSRDSCCSSHPPITASDRSPKVSCLPIVTARLSSARLSSARLSSARLSSARLSSARHSSARLSSARLSSARLSSARLSSARLSSARLSSARLSSARLSSARLSSARLSSARLSSARLSSARLSSARLSSARLSSARLSSARLSSARLSSARLSSARLSSARLSSARLSSARLSSARLSSARLSSARLSLFPSPTPTFTIRLYCRFCFLCEPSQSQMSFPPLL
ncbi:unnamed protein product [Closterium sp. Yama58-4]|nr:unnamed protein product [Closterium sp. Yama58-4]